MIKYHIFGKVNKEEYYFTQDVSFMTFRYNFHRNYASTDWEYRRYPIYKDTTEDEIYKNILRNNVFSSSLMIKGLGKYLDKNIPNCKIFNKEYSFNSYTEYKTIEIDVELRSGEVIHIDGEDYEVEYIFNSDKMQHELYIDKVVEIIVDEELLKHAKEVCNGVVKKILRYNKEIGKIQKEIDQELKDKKLNEELNKTVEPVFEVKWYQKIVKLFNRKEC
ncbi:MAG: hypothetical protein ACRCVJ_18465 [Clostridium sp.]|uniref:hypothetical protein n=1 Tax=Clostridium sp. TaxID=1506 RepID=UPI003F2B5A70